MRVPDCPVIESKPDVMGVFAGTRVPIQTLLDYLGAGHPLDDFPTVKREQTVALLEHAKVLLVASAGSPR